MKWFNRLQVKTQFMLIGLLIAPFLLGLIGAGAWGIFQLGNLLHQTITQSIPSILYLGQSVEEIELVRVSYRNMLIDDDLTKIQKDITNTEDTLAQAQKSWEQYTALPNDEAEKALWPQLEEDWKEWSASIDQLNKLALAAALEKDNPGQNRQQVLEVLGKTSALAEKVVATLNQLTQHQYTDSQELREQSDSTFTLVLSVMLSGAAGTVLIIVIAGLALARSIIQLTNNQSRLNRQISQAFTNIEEKRQVGEKVSQQLKSMTTELNATTNQQATGSQQQAAAITEVITSLTELAQTADNIATTSKRIDQVTEEVLSSTQSVNAVTLKATQTGEQGWQAMQETIGANQQVSQFYQGLVQLLAELYRQSSEIKEINTVMRQISDETHLLALNAAIEAAGANEHGERFAVVASAVKELADRSVNASKEVEFILAKLQDRIQQAVANAESGQKKTQLAEAIAQQTGTVIEELVKAIKHSAERVATIGEAMRTLNELTQEITFATSQQSSASTQTVETLQEIGIIARQTASSSIQVTATVQNLEELSHELNLSLAV